MSVFIDNSTRFFTVVGAAYIPEQHLDSYGDDVERRTSLRSAIGANALSRADSSGWWPHDHGAPGARAACR